MCPDRMLWPGAATVAGREQASYVICREHIWFLQLVLSWKWGEMGTPAVDNHVLTELWPGHCRGCGLSSWDGSEFCSLT